MTTLQYNPWDIRPPLQQIPQLLQVDDSCAASEVQDLNIFVLREVSEDRVLHWIWQVRVANGQADLEVVHEVQAFGVELEVDS